MGFDRQYPPESWGTQDAPQMGMSRSEAWDFNLRQMEFREAQEAGILDQERKERAKRAMSYLTEAIDG